MAEPKPRRFVSIRMHTEIYEKVTQHHAEMREQVPDVVKVPVCAAIESLIVEGFESFERKRQQEEGS